MKASMLGLAISTVAFGGTTIYFWQQLAEQRAKTQQVESASAELRQRITELETTRASMFAQRRFGPGGFEGGAHAGPPPGPPGAGDSPGDAKGEKPEFATRRFDPNAKRPEMPAGMVKMMRADMRAQNQRTYFDLQQKLGLSDDEANKLLDLITDQQTQRFQGWRGGDSEEARAQWEDAQAKQQQQISDLLGPTKAAQFEDYQKTVPSRMELQMLSRQLEGSEQPLSDSQRGQMLDALVEERARVPMPTFTDSTASQDEIAKADHDWQTDYEQRVASAARSILSTDQYTTFNEYQQWQQQMREQFAAQGVAGPRGMRGGGNFFFAAPIGGQAVTVTTTSSAPTQQKKP